MAIDSKGWAKKLANTVQCGRQKVRYKLAYFLDGMCEVNTRVHTT